MGLIRNIFGGSSEDSSQPTIKKEIKSVPDLFRLDIVNIPYDEFTGTKKGFLRLIWRKKIVTKL